MRKLYLYAHGGSGNHGCEAIVRSTIKILREENITLISSRPEEDNYYGLDQICNIIKDKCESIRKINLDFLKAYLSLKIKKDYIPMDKLWYKKAFSNIKKGDIAISIGGDNYCYANVKEYVMLHDILKSRGAKTVLWGCSVEPSVAKNPDIAADLARYDLITARETITYETLKKINSNTVLVSDPAFLLEKKKVTIPETFVEGNTVGINISPMVIENEGLEGITYQNYINLIQYILEETSMNIALIPHVVWEKGDDREPLNRLLVEFKNSDRIILLKDCKCEEMKYIISKCRFFIGARTHSTIAAYSSGVPTLVVGYSVKARGIARDIFGSEEGYVLPVQELQFKNTLKDAFANMFNQEEYIRSYLREKMNSYCSKADVYDKIKML